MTNKKNLVVKESQTSLEQAEEMFRKVYMKAVSDYEASLRELEASKNKKAPPPSSTVTTEEVEGFNDEVEEEEVMSWLRWPAGEVNDDEEVDWRDLKVPSSPFEEEPTWLSEPVRVRWSKDEILAICNWPKAHWTKLKNRLELKVGLIMLKQGAGNPWKGEVVRCWTFSTSPEDRRFGLLNSPALQAQERLRLKQAIQVTLLRESQREVTEEEIKEELEAQKVKLDEILTTLRTIKKDLLTPEMLKQLKDEENKGD